MTLFAIYTLPVGGGTIALSPLPGRGGRYDDDWAQLGEWGLDGVLSLTETGEMQAWGAGAFQRDLESVGVQHWHFPIIDYGVPTDESADLWREIQTDILQILKRGGHVLVHCLGGCGRSGLAVLRIMIAAGEGPDAALVRLRAVRPCAIETPAQLAWATQPD